MKMASSSRKESTATTLEAIESTASEQSNQKPFYSQKIGGSSDWKMIGRGPKPGIS